MKKVYFIHENTAPLNIRGVYKQFPTGYVCAVGYIEEEHEMDPNMDSSHTSVYAHDEEDSYEIDNAFRDVFFDTYEEGEKELAKLMATFTSRFPQMLEERDRLEELYPEKMI